MIFMKQREAGKAMLKLNNVSRIYRTDEVETTALDSVNIEIGEGDFAAIMGPSGCGKSTLLKIIGMLDSPTSGEYWFKGQNIAGWPEARLAGLRKASIGFVFQNYALFKHMTVYDNIAFGLKVKKQSKEQIRERVMSLVELTGLKGFEHRYAHQLSGGQRQRVAFARALAPEPQLLLLDEPFAAIDAKIRTELRTWLKEMIEREMEHARAGRPARLMMKVNAITDDQMIRVLYRAAQAGVSMDLMVRGICCLRPGVPGVSDTIRVRSIVGRFLEHSRLFWFYNNGDEEMYIGSADLMERNLDRRVESLAPIRDPEIREHLRDIVLGAYIRDTEHAMVLDALGHYDRPAVESERFDAQQFLIRHYTEIGES